MTIGEQIALAAMAAWVLWTCWILRPLWWVMAPWLGLGALIFLLIHFGVVT